MKVREQTVSWTVKESWRRIKVELLTKFYQWIKTGE